MLACRFSRVNGRRGPPAEAWVFGCGLEPPAEAGWKGRDRLRPGVGVRLGSAPLGGVTDRNQGSTSMIGGWSHECGPGDPRPPVSGHRLTPASRPDGPRGALGNGDLRCSPELCHLPPPGSVKPPGSAPLPGSASILLALARQRQGRRKRSPGYGRSPSGPSGGDADGGEQDARAPRESSPRGRARRSRSQAVTGTRASRMLALPESTPPSHFPGALRPTPHVDTGEGPC